MKSGVEAVLEAGSLHRNTEMQLSNVNIVYIRYKDIFMFYVVVVLTKQFTSRSMIQQSMTTSIGNSCSDTGLQDSSEARSSSYESKPNVSKVSHYLLIVLYAYCNYCLLIFHRFSMMSVA